MKAGEGRTRGGAGLVRREVGNKELLCTARTRPGMYRIKARVGQEARGVSRGLRGAKREERWEEREGRELLDEKGAAKDR